MALSKKKGGGVKKKFDCYSIANDLVFANRPNIFEGVLIDALSGVSIVAGGETLPMQQIENLLELKQRIENTLDWVISKINELSDNEEHTFDCNNPIRLIKI